MNQADAQAAIVPDTAPPGWFAAEIASMQANQDSVYQSNVAIYKQALADWVTTNVANRDAKRAFTTPPTKPQREVIYAGVGLQIGEYTAAVDPSLPNPSLPAPVPVQPSSAGFASGAAANTDAVNAALVRIEAKIDNLAALLGPNPLNKPNSPAGVLGRWGGI